MYRRIEKKIIHKRLTLEKVDIFGTCRCVCGVDHANAPSELPAFDKLGTQVSVHFVVND